MRGPGAFLCAVEFDSKLLSELKDRQDRPRQLMRVSTRWTEGFDFSGKKEFTNGQAIVPTLS